jgi:hypothetical protein
MLNKQENSGQIIERLTRENVALRAEVTELKAAIAQERERKKSREEELETMLIQVSDDLTWYRKRFGARLAEEN